MALRPIIPTLRTIHNGSNTVAKTSINVPAGDELVVSDEVADQLLRARVGFKEGSAPEVQVEEPAKSGDSDEAPVPVKKAAGRAKK